MITSRHYAARGQYYSISVASVCYNRAALPEVGFSQRQNDTNKTLVYARVCSVDNEYHRQL